MCLDTGHFNIFKSDDIYEDCLKINKKLQVLHIHDNNSYTDAHEFPYMGSFNWDKFAKALKEIDFDGVLSLETNAPNSVPSEEIYNLLDEALFKIIASIRL